MAEKSDVIRKLDQEIEAFAAANENHLADFRRNKLAYYTALRNGIEVMPLNAPQIDALYGCKNLLKHADEIYTQHIFPGENQSDVTEFAYRFVEDVYREERMERLWERLQRENEDFHEEILRKSPQEIFDKAYEITMKYDLLTLFEESDMSARKIDTLLSFKYPLEAMYQEWLDTDVSYMDLLRDTVDNLIHEQDEYLQRQDYITDGETPSPDISVWNAMYDNDMCSYDETKEHEADEDLEP